MYGEGAGSSKAEKTWVEGVNEWHKMKEGKCKGRLHKHFESTSHNMAKARLQNKLSKPQHIDAMLSKEIQRSRIQEEEDRLRNREIIKILLDCTRYLARQMD